MAPFPLGAKNGRQRYIFVAAPKLVGARHGMGHWSRRDGVRQSFNTDLAAIREATTYTRVVGGKGMGRPPS